MTRGFCRAIAVGFALACLAGCATRGTIRELGRPEFEGAVPADAKLTLVEPRVPGQLHAFPGGAGEGDYRAETWMTIPAHREGDEVVFDMNATGKGDRRIALLEVLAFPLPAKDVLRFKEEGKLPGGEPIARDRSTKPIPGKPVLHVELHVPVARAAGVDQLALPILLVFEDGWVTIRDNVVLLPPG